MNFETRCKIRWIIECKKNEFCSTYNISDQFLSDYNYDDIFVPSLNDDKKALHMSPLEKPPMPVMQTIEEEKIEERIKNLSSR